MSKKQNIWIVATGLTLSLLGFLLHRASSIAFFYKKDLFYPMLAFISLSIFLVATYLVFIKKDSEGNSDWSNNLRRAGTPSKKLALIMFSCIFWPGISISSGLILTNIPAVVCQELPTDTFSKTVVVTEINETGRTPGVVARISFTVNDEGYSDSIKWNLSALRSSDIGVGNNINLQGQSCQFGHVVKKITREHG